MEYFEWGYLGLLLVCFLSATVLPFPSEAVFILFLLHDYPPLAVIGVATLGNSMGGFTTYLLGVFGSRLRPIDIQLRWVKLANKRGAVSALLSWIPFVGDPILFLLGYLRTNLIRTVFWMVLGKCLRYWLIAWPFL
jgi:membrane protein YqaA with SNARE-associated domain